MFTTVGTPEYCAPEVGFEYSGLPPHMRMSGTKGHNLARKGYDHKCDIWSLGIIVHIMLSGVSPFYEDGDEVNIIQSAKRGELKLHNKQWGGVSHDAKEFVQSLLYVDVQRRYCIDECFADPWIKKHEHELAHIYEKISRECWFTMRDLS